VADYSARRPHPSQNSNQPISPSQWLHLDRCTFPSERTWFPSPLTAFVASADDTVKIHPYSSEGQSGEKKRPIKPIQHPTGVKALLPLYIPSLDETHLFTASGDTIRSWDTSDLDDKVEQRNEIDGHWHDVTLLKAWFASPDPYILSASLDGTIRRWKVTGESV